MKSKIPLIMIFIWSIVTLIWWGIAFYPSPDSMQWLEVARQVCFGVTDTGLPETYGWMLLILAPLACLSVIIVGWKDELIEGFKNIYKSKVALFTMPVLLSLAIVEVSWVKNKLNYANELKNISQINLRSDFPKNYYRVDKDVKDFKLIDQYGEEVSLKKFKGQVKILTFAFAHCQTVCPLLVTKSLEAIKSFEKEAIPLLIITLDPWRDTPKSLPFLAKKWGLPESAYVLSGEIEEVNKVIESFGVPTKRNEKDGDIQHPEVSFIIDQNNKIAFILNKAPTDWLIQAVKRVQTETVVFKNE